MKIKTHPLLNSKVHILQAQKTILGVYDTQEKATEAAALALKKGLAGWGTLSPKYTISSHTLNAQPERTPSDIELHLTEHPDPSKRSLSPNT